MVKEVHVGTRPIESFHSLLGEARMAKALAVGEHAKQRLSNRVVWNVSSTEVGGGVAEMLTSLLTYARSVGIDTRWLVISGDRRFFQITKRLHHALHGAPGDNSGLGDAERTHYENVLRGNASEILTLVRPNDVVVLHDPQTAGLAPALVQLGALVIWRCHIGHDALDEHVEAGWAFLRPSLENVPRFVFSREAYVPDFCDHGRSRVIQPSIDAFSAKNQALSPDAVHTILVHVGLVEGPPPATADHGFQHADGTPGRVERRADVIRLGRAPTWDTPLIVQVSRWDPLKDPVGVMRGFARLLNHGGAGAANLVLAGPNVHAVADDPEAAAVLEHVTMVWRGLPHSVRDRIHLASLPTASVEENAAIVNALQRHATVMVQKSLHEGFGLTVTEAMWKARPTVASAVGGIQDQIEDGRSGILLKNPNDLEGFCAALRLLLEDPALAARLGSAARERVRERFLGVRHLLEYAALIEELDDERNPRDG